MNPPIPLDRTDIIRANSQPITNISQIYVGALLLENKMIAEITKISIDGIAFVVVNDESTTPWGKGKTGTINTEQFQETIDKGDHTMVIIGKKEDYPEYYL